METSSVIKVEQSGRMGSTGFQKFRKLSRVSPFLLLNLFLIFWFPIAIIMDNPAVTRAKIIAFPFLVAYVAFADFAIWNYLEGKMKWLIWIIEIIFSAIILYWVV